MVGKQDVDMDGNEEWVVLCDAAYVTDIYGYLNRIFLDFGNIGFWYWNRLGGCRSVA